MRFRHTLLKPRHRRGECLLIKLRTSCAQSNVFLWAYVISHTRVGENLEFVRVTLYVHMTRLQEHV